MLLALMKNYEMTELDAADIYYTSKTYGKLTDEITELYKKIWQEIYEFLKTELKYQKRKN